MEHERTADYWQDNHRALENAVYNSEHDIVPCVQCGCKIVAPLLADSPRCKDCREGTIGNTDLQGQLAFERAENARWAVVCDELEAQLAAAEAALREIADFDEVENTEGDLEDVAVQCIAIAKISMHELGGLK